MLIPTERLDELANLANGCHGNLMHRNYGNAEDYAERIVQLLDGLNDGRTGMAMPGAGQWHVVHQDHWSEDHWEVRTEPGPSQDGVLLASIPTREAAELFAALPLFRCLAYFSRLALQTSGADPDMLRELQAALLPVEAVLDTVPFEA